MAVCPAGYLIAMTRLEWGKQPRLYEEGVDQGVLYSGGTGVPWNGLVSVNEKEGGDTDTEHYLDGVRTVITQNLSEFAATIEAYTYPDEFEEYSGYSESVSGKRFGLSYRTAFGDGYKIHLVYGAAVVPSARSWSTLNESPDLSTFAWDISATPVPILGASPGSHLILDTRESPDVTEAIEDVLYGSSTSEPRLPNPQEVIELCELALTLRITYNGDGTWTATGPEGLIQVNVDGSFQLSSHTAFLLNSGLYTVNSY